MTDGPPVVYVIDDDASVRKAVSRLLRSAGLAVETLASAEEFLERPVVDRPSCLVLDVRMPGSSRMDLQGKIHRSHMTHKMEAGSVAELVAMVQTLQPPGSRR